MGIKNISDKIRVSKDRIFYNINMRDIDYIRAYNSETQIFAKGETFRSDDSLVAVEEILDKCVFFKISRSFCNMHRDLKCVRTHLVIHTYASGYTYVRIGLYIRCHRATHIYASVYTYVCN